ncbi:MAG: two-component sensor histidine kinase [Hyphomonas sp.]|nr:two-component sensor histidine kinase [Hyphomonas sp.]
MSEALTMHGRKDARRKSSRRIRDFVMLQGCFAAVFLLLMVTGSIGIVEAIAAMLAAGAVSAAYYVGSSAVSPPDVGSEMAVASLPAGPAASVVPVKALPLPAFEIDLDQRIIAYNAAAEDILRLDGRIKPRASTVIRSPALLSAIDEAIQVPAETPATVEVDAGPDETWRAYVTRPVRADRILIVLEDLTPLRRAARSRSDFIANASHELRTPLTALSGFIETMRGPARDDPESWGRFLDIMAIEAERMSRLIADLLSLSRIESSEQVAPRDRVNLRDVLKAGASALEGFAEKKDMRLDVSIPEDACPVIGSYDELIQVVENLVSNAIKYSPPGGTVRVSAGRAPSAQDARTRSGQAWPDGERMTLLQTVARVGVGVGIGDAAVWVRVEDEGPGIEREHLPRLGERFYRTDQSRGGKITGTGLGLAIVKHIMAHHRGGMAVETRMGKGTAFAVWLPAAPAKADA